MVLSATLFESSNFFALFSLPSGWQVDRGLLDARYRKLQQEFHPDRFAAKGDVDKRLALQTTSLINQAYDTLKSPLKRAQYLLQLQDLDAAQESHITSDGAFLMQQIEFREALGELTEGNESNESADPMTTLDSMRTDVQSQYLQLQNDFEAQHLAANYNDALDTVAKMQFFSKLLNEIDQREEELEDF